MNLLSKDGKYKDEHELFGRALVSESARNELRRYARQLSVKIADKYTSPKYSRTLLSTKGMKYFGRAFRNYTKHFIGGKRWKFSTYYAWWIRQAITEFLHNEK